MKPSTATVYNICKDTIYRAARLYHTATKRHGNDAEKVAQCIEDMGKDCSDYLFEAQLIAETEAAKKAVREARGKLAGYELEAQGLARKLAARA